MAAINDAEMAENPALVASAPPDFVLDLLRELRAGRRGAAQRG